MISVSIAYIAMHRYIGNPVDFWVISKFYEHSTHAKQQSLTDRGTAAALAHRGTHLHSANQSL